MFCRIKFKASFKEYVFKEINDEQALVANFLQLVQKTFKFNKKTSKLIIYNEHELELSPHDFIEHGKMYIIKRMPF